MRVCVCACVVLVFDSVLLVVLFLGVPNYGGHERIIFFGSLLSDSLRSLTNIHILRSPVPT